MFQKSVLHKDNFLSEMQAFQVADMAETPSLPTMLTTKATLHKNPKDPKPYAPYHIPLPHPTTSQKQSVCV